MRCATVLFATLCAMPATAADLNFCWMGAAGYTMTGKMQVPDSKMYRAVVTEKDVTRFKIAGYLHGQLLGTWDMKQAGPDTTWHLRFDPMGMTFLTGGSFAGTHSQGWNADGNVENCGSPGFGFNSGNYAQDICVNGIYIHHSSIDPATAFLATTQAVTPDCGTTPPVSKSRRRESGD